MIRNLVAFALLVAAVSAGGYIGAAPYSSYGSYGYASPAIGGYGYHSSPYSYGAAPYAYSAYSSPYYSPYTSPLATSYANTYKYSLKSPYYSGYSGYSPYGYSGYSSPYYGGYVR